MIRSKRAEHGDEPSTYKERTHLMLTTTIRRQINRAAIGIAGLVFTFAAVVGFTGCKADEAPSTGFTTAKMMDKDPTLPFHRVWKKQGVDFHRYNKLYVANVNTEYMMAQTDWQKGMRKEEIEADVQKLRAYTKQAVEQAFQKDPKKRFQVVSAPSGDGSTLIMEMALTEVVPSKVVLNALGYAPFGIGMAITGVRMIAKDESSVAFEARLRDASTKEVIAMVADREAEQFAPVSVRGLTWYSHAETMVDQWAQQFVEIANRQPGETVKDTDAFTLKPW
jgi:hypothetical protein